MKKVLILLLIFFILLTAANVVFAYSLYPGKWPNNKATMYTTGFKATDYANSMYESALSRWNGLSDFSFSFNKSFRDPCGGNNGWGFNNSYCGVSFGRTTLAVTMTQINMISKRITRSSIIFNIAKRWAAYSGANPYNVEVFDFRRVATHESGHALGLGHDNTYRALMNTTYSQTIETPQADDIRGIKALYGGNSGGNRDRIAAFVTRFYQQCLDREPDSGGLNHWTDMLLSGQLSGSDVAYGFVFSREFLARNTTNEQFLFVMYRAFFAREPDPGGWRDWLNYLNRGNSRLNTLYGFTHSQEFANLCQSYGIRQFYEEAPFNYDEVQEKLIE